MFSVQFVNEVCQVEFSLVDQWHQPVKLALVNSWVDHR